jgi:hypothetical protein
MMTREMIIIPYLIIMLGNNPSYQYVKIKLKFY